MVERGRAVSAGNRGFGDSLANSYDKDAAPPARPLLPTDSVLSSRSTSLAELASGKLVNERTLWVAADRCRPWVHHNRDQALLNAHSCVDLIDSFKAEGRQRLAAIVRRVKDDPDHEFEIIAGVRRHWTVAWLNAHNYPDFEFLVTVQTLTDEEAFRLADVENRARQDLTDLERARDYLKALDLFYGGKQSDMAARLNVAPAWLSRLLELARLPESVLRCFPDPRELRVEHAKQLAPLLKIGPAAKRMIATAEELAIHQQEAVEAGRIPVRTVDIVRQLLAAAVAPGPRSKATASITTLASRAGRPMMRVQPQRRGARLELLGGSGASRDEVLAAFAAWLDEYPEPLPFG